MASQPTQDIELKEIYDRNRFLSLLQQWAQSIERQQAFDIQVNGQRFTIPADAVDRGRLRVEYEIDKGEYEFELTLKWR